MPTVSCTEGSRPLRHGRGITDQAAGRGVGPERRLFQGVSGPARPLTRCGTAGGFGSVPRCLLPRGPRGSPHNHGKRLGLASVPLRGDPSSHQVTHAEISLIFSTWTFASVAFVTSWETRFAFIFLAAGICLCANYRLPCTWTDSVSIPKKIETSEVMATPGPLSLRSLVLLQQQRPGEMQSACSSNLEAKHGAGRPGTSGHLDSLPLLGPSSRNHSLILTGQLTP